MGTVITVVMVVLIIVVVLSASVNSIKKSGQKMKHKDRCEACKSRLKAVNGVYATTCRRCGHRQSWA